MTSVINDGEVSNRGAESEPLSSDQDRVQSEVEEERLAMEAGGNHFRPSNTEPRLRPGPKPKKNKVVRESLTIAGSKEVFAQFRRFCLQKDVTLCDGLRVLLSENQQKLRKTSTGVEEDPKA